MTPDQKKLTIAAIVIALIIASIELFRYMKPGVYFKYKCNNGGDDTRKFYDPTWQARGAVCDGLYIPISAKLSGANTTRVLEWMGEINKGKPIPTNSKDMTTLANAAADYVNSH